jgi:hypothetical protein
VATGSLWRASGRPVRRAAESVALAALLVLGAGSVWQDGSSTHDSSAPDSSAPDLNIPVSRPAINGSQRPALPAAQQAAVERLAADNPAASGAHSHGDPHVFGPASEVRLTPDEASAFAGEWATARSAAAQFPTVAAAEAAGYVLSSVPAPGVGVHYVNWELISRPFDPARPSMLLYSDGHLVGFSYWVESPTEPAGFTGTNDHWHTHHGLCVVNGWVEREDVERAADCPGTLLDGGNLWMLHAWVVPAYPNRWGQFALTNPMLCPARTKVPDLASCSPDQG